MSCRGLIAAVATVAAILSGGAGAGLAPAQSRQEPDLAVNGQVICGSSRCPHGYPHDSIAIQRPGTATFQMQSCAAAGCPYGWQSVPNWPDGSYFWMAA